MFGRSGTVILTNGVLQSGRGSFDAGGGSEDSVRPQTEYHGESRPFGRPIPKPDANTLNPDKGPGITYEVNTRPPLAGPYAFSKLPEPVDNLPKIYLSGDLPDTWIFTNITTDSEGVGSLPVKVPDTTNTSYIVSAFALDQLTGLGVTPDAVESGVVEIFQPFYVRAHLPYSMKVGETLSVQMIVYNYRQKDISAEVTLENTPDRSFVFGVVDDDDNNAAAKITTSDPASTKNLDLFRTKRVQVSLNTLGQITVLNSSFTLTLM